MTGHPGGGIPKRPALRRTRGGRIQITVLRRATHWDEVVAELGYEHLRRYTLRHTVLAWFADAGVLLHLLQEVAGHADPRVIKLYLHPNTAALQWPAIYCRYTSKRRNGHQLATISGSSNDEKSPSD
ncbi:tyrosine-type recombinase/integrase [Nocardia tengchongensis]|uniref:Tyrosine-type recombinase/integrase n=1 Tax=Nocardia tengchongensis TaxID=2055889 RepID=A0ABX8CFN4_9NOCA|nr:tyrosine-type recombinase/integrase [Nocardia tengchongensis]QVI18784.1 tyrosine-type recombinase/integrase [Nocardia tengchongensis]